MSKHQTSLEKIEKIERKKDEAVFLVCEFTKLGGEDQILRGSYRSGQGPVWYGSATPHGRASPSRLTPDGFAREARQALDEPGVEGEPTEAENAYDEGLLDSDSRQTRSSLKGRFSRKGPDHHLCRHIHQFVAGGINRLNLGIWSGGLRRLTAAASADDGGGSSRCRWLPRAP
ncbi:hypothetical protein ACVW0I_001244 [Bradyrhizobium sp. LM6.11]